jgi:hypothetical protein
MRCNKKAAHLLIEKWHREADYLRKKGEEKEWHQSEECCYALVELYRLLTGEVPMITGLILPEPGLPAVEFSPNNSARFEVYGITGDTSSVEYVRRVDNTGDLDDQEQNAPGTKLLPTR